MTEESPPHVSVSKQTSFLQELVFQRFIYSRQAMHFLKMDDFCVLLVTEIDGMLNSC